MKIADRGILRDEDFESNKDQISRNGSNFRSPQMQQFLQNDKDEIKSILSPKGKFNRDEEHSVRRMSIMNQTMSNVGSIRKLPICGDRDATKQGYSMFEWHSKTNPSISAEKRSLLQMQYWVGGSICACRLIMTDGSKSPKFGKFHPLDKFQSLARTD